MHQDRPKPKQPRFTAFKRDAGRVLLGAALLLTLAACSRTASPDAQNTVGEIIPGQYIVMLKGPALGTQNAPSQQSGLEIARVAADLGVQSLGELRSIGGFIAAGVDRAALARLEADPRVRYAEPDRIVTVSATQSSPTWGIDRIDERDLPLSNSYSYSATGSGVNAYVIDTGIKKGLSEFGSRLAGGISAINDGRGYDDCNGHGTHVAGTLGGKTYGVAKGVKLYAVRVFGCSGSSSNSTIISGVDWVTYNHDAPAVANMSLESVKSQALDEAVSAAIREGVTVVAAAGNASSNACNTSPARISSVITVGASNRYDEGWNQSNYGSCLDLFAPGEGVTSVSTSGGKLARSGTSMAAPHVSGVAALILQNSRTASPSTVASRIKNLATKGELSDIGSGSPNSLLFSNF